MRRKAGTADHSLAVNGRSNHIIYVIGHKSPDSDTVGSAMAYASLLNAMGIPAEGAAAGMVNNETKYALGVFGIDAPSVVYNAKGKRFFLVDHSSFSQAVNGMKEAEITGIIDHHDAGDITEVNVGRSIIERTGATASLVFGCYKEYGADIPRDIARLLVMSILSDTRNMKINVTETDRTAYDALLKIAEIEDVNALYQGMSEAAASYGDMTDEEIFRSDCKEYEAGGRRFCVASVYAFGEGKVQEMTDRMYRVMADTYDVFGLDLMFAKINNRTENGDENMMYMAAYGDGAETVLENTFNNFDGHRYFIFRENISRKTAIIPAITAALEDI